MHPTALANIPLPIAMLASVPLSLVIVRAIVRPSTPWSLLGFASMLALGLFIYARGAA